MGLRGLLTPSAFMPRPNDPLRSLRRSALPVDTTALARFLIGKILVRDHSDGRTTGRIVETEAYVVGDAAAHTFRGETCVTADKFSVDSEGYYTYHGRADDLLKVGGRYVAPLEVEAVLLSH